MRPAAFEARVPSFRYADEIANAAADGRKSERTQTRLQAAACRLLETVPPSELKVTDICREAGVAHGTFYVYFRDIRHMLAIIPFIVFGIMPFDRITECNQLVSCHLGNFPLK